LDTFEEVNVTSFGNLDFEFLYGFLTLETSLSLQYFGRKVRGEKAFHLGLLVTPATTQGKVVINIGD
jgi:hypothetical protein